MRTLRAIYHTIRQPRIAWALFKMGVDEGRLERDGWRKGNDGLWRNNRFGGSYKHTNAVKRIGSQHGEVTR